MSIVVIPTQANRIRAVAAADPELNRIQIAALVGVLPHLVYLALQKGDNRRIKSVAK